MSNTKSWEPQRNGRENTKRNSARRDDKAD